jgi:hypothetical protein
MRPTSGLQGKAMQGARERRKCLDGGSDKEGRQDRENEHAEVMHREKERRRGLAVRKAMADRDEQRKER